MKKFSGSLIVLGFIISALGFYVENYPLALAGFAVAAFGLLLLLFVLG